MEDKLTHLPNSHSYVVLKPKKKKKDLHIFSISDSFHNTFDRPTTSHVGKKLE